MPRRLRTTRWAAWLAALVGTAVLVGVALDRTGLIDFGGRVGSQQRPERCPDCNVLLLSIDTLRADHLGSYGYARATSPNIDRLASRSLRWTDVLAQSPTTAPSHRSMFSGRYVDQHRNSLRGLPVMAELLADAGYRTAAFVDGAQLRPEFGLSKGFESYESTEGRHVEGAQIGGGLEQLNPRIVRWLEKNGDERFFLFVQTYDVHCPYTPPEPYFSMFTGDYEPAFRVRGRCGIRYFNGLDMKPADFDYVAALYDGGIRHADDKVQEILDALRRLGLSDDTVVVVTSDHGESLGERNLVGHNRVYDVHLKVPLIIGLPSGRARAMETPAQSIDLLPTLLGIVGLTSPAGLPGIDLLSRLDEPGDENRLRMAQTADGSITSVNEGTRWALIVSSGRVDGLYDLHADPRQETDLAQSHPEVVARLLQAYRERGVRHERLGVRPGNLDRRTLEELEALGYVEE